MTRKKTGTFTNKWKLNYILLNNKSVKVEIKRKIKIYLETNKNGNTTLQNLWYVAKVVLRGTFIVINAYVKQTKKDLK